MTKTANECGLTPSRGGQKVVLAVMGLFLLAVFASSFFSRLSNPTIVRQVEMPGGSGSGMGEMPGGQDMGQIRELMRMLGEDPENPELNLAVAEEFLDMGAYEEAQHFLNTALVAQPSDSETLYLLGLTSYQLEEFSMSAGYMEEALRSGLDFEEAPAEVDVLNLCGVAYFRLEEYDKAAEKFLLILEHDPESHLAQLNLATVYNFGGRRGEAEVIFEALLEDPTVPEDIKQMAQEELAMDPAEMGGQEQETQGDDEAQVPEEDATASPAHEGE
ncbi:MAG: hypothetical protein D6E12_03845 [Desulfovibrio sp.]|nr:MAG: hypothetical protein D6E12_03845 [Desulfovibrio sp.]